MTNLSSDLSAENPISSTIALTKPRIDWLDYAKGIGIFLVVLGHAIRGLYDSANLATPGQFAALDSWIYSFHMPLFFFLSGLFSPSANRKSIKTFWADKFRNIIYPYLIWSVIIGLLRTLSGSNKETLISFFSNLWRLSYYPNDIFWFLYALFLIATVHFILNKIRLSLVIITALGLVMQGIYFFYTPPLFGNPIEKLLIYFSYFAIGGLLSNLILNHPNLNQPNINRSILISGALSGFGLITLATYFNFLVTKEPNLILGLIGISACLFLAKMISQINKLAFIKKWGYLSLQIYVMHTAVIAIVRMILQKSLKINDLAVHITLETMLGIYLPLLLVQFTNKIKFPYLFSIPKPVKHKSIPSE